MTAKNEFGPQEDFGLNEQSREIVFDAGEDGIDTALPGRGDAIEEGRVLPIEGVEWNPGGDSRIGRFSENGGNLRNILCFEHSAEIPAERSIGACVIVHRIERIGLIEENAQFVFAALEALGEDFDGFAGGSGFFRVEKEEDEIGDFDEGADGGRAAAWRRG